MAQDFYTESGFVPEVFSKKLALAERKQSNFKERMTNREWEGEIKRYGDVVHISLPDPANVTIGTTSGKGVKVCPVSSEVTPTKKDLTIDKIAYFQFYFNDVEVQQVQFNLYEGYGALAVTKMGDARSQELEQAVIDDNNVPALSTANEPIALTEANVYRQFTALKIQLVKTGAVDKNGFYEFKGNSEESKKLSPIVTITPEIYEILLNADVLVHPTVAGDDVIKSGEKAMVAGMEIDVDLKLAEVTVNGSELAEGVFPAIAGTKMGITYADQYSKVEKLRDINCFGDIVRGMQLYGYLIVHPESLVKAFFSIS